MVMTNDVDRAKIRTIISDMVREHWESTNKAMLLSAIGSRLRQAFPSAPLVLSDGLRAFLDSWPVVKIVTHPEIREKVGAVPLDVAIPENAATLFSERQFASVAREAAPVEILRPRYRPEFWRAFHTPIVGRRFVLSPDGENPHVRIVDLPNGAEEPDGGIEILSSDVSLLPAQASLTDKVQGTSQKIRAWLARNNLSPQPFVSLIHPASSQPLSLRYPDPRASFALALARLDPSDQSRIFIPLDIVAKMIAGVR